MDTKQQWENPTETLDTVIGILTGLPVTETFGMDAIGVATDAMNEIMDLRRQLNEANQAIRDLRESATIKKELIVCPGCLTEGFYLGSDGYKVICETCNGKGMIEENFETEDYKSTL